MSWEKCSLLVAALVLGSAVAQASADTVDLAFTGVSPGRTESVSTTGTGGSFNGENTGQFNFNATNKTGGAAAVIPGASVATWCVELAQVVSGSSNTYTILGPGSFVPPLTNAQGVLLTAFFNQFYTPILTNTPFNNDQAAAFQLDIWELLYENTIKTPYSLGSGDFVVQGSDTAVTTGNTWLASFNTATVGPLQLFQLHNDGLQDQIVVGPGGGTGNPTPLPAALPGGLLLIAGAALYGKLQRKTAV